MASPTQAANSGSIDANGGNGSSAVANGNTNVEGGDLIHFLEPSITEEPYRSQSVVAGARLELQVRPENPAMRLYEPLGFRVAGEAGFAVKMVWSAADEMQSGEENP
jgi:hypothetical protein